MRWNKENSTYYSAGRKAFGFGDEIPQDIIEKMGSETVEEYTENGWLLADEVEEVVEEVAEEGTEEPVIEFTKKELFQMATEMGLNPKKKDTKTALQGMIDESNR